MAALPSIKPMNSPVARKSGPSAAEQACRPARRGNHIDYPELSPFIPFVKAEQSRWRGFQVERYDMTQEGPGKVAERRPVRAEYKLYLA